MKLSIAYGFSYDFQKIIMLLEFGEEVHIVIVDRVVVFSLELYSIIKFYYLNDLCI